MLGLQPLMTLGIFQNFLDGPDLLLASMAFFFFFFGIAVQVLVCSILYSCLQAVPPQFRRQTPGSSYLLLIPIFNLVWNFVIFLAVAGSYQDYFAHQGRTTMADCARSVALAYCVCGIFLIVPVLNILAAVPALILLIITLVKFWDIKQQLPPRNPTQA